MSIKRDYHALVFEYMSNEGVYRASATQRNVLKFFLERPELDSSRVIV